MKPKVSTGIMLTLLLIGTLKLTFNIQSVEASKPLAPNGVHNISTYESRIGEEGLLFEDANLQMWVPRSFENHATIIFDYLAAGYTNLSRIFGDHEYPYKFSIEHYPEGSPYGWGGTDAQGTIRYGYSNLEDDTPEWNLHGVPHVIGYYEEMSHCFARDLGVRGEVSVGFYETLGMMIGGETTLRAAYNPYIEALIANSYQTYNETTSYYLEHDVGPPGIPENIWLTRVLAHMFKTEVVNMYGWDTLADVFEALQDNYPLREYDRDHTWGGFLYYLGKVTTTDFYTVFGNYGLPIMTWTGESGYKSDGVENVGNKRYRFKVKCFDREGTQPTKVQLHLYNDGSISASPYLMSFIGGDNETGWIYEKEVELEEPLFKYAFSADDGAHSIFQALGKPTVKHMLHASLRVHNVDTGEDFSTIQEAIDASETLDGHTIFVDEGTYYEHVVVDKSLSLIGADKFNTIIDGNNTGNVMSITASNVNITGFTIQNGGAPSPPRADSGVYVSSSGNNISCNIVTDNYYYGIELEGSSNNSISGNNITNNGGGIGLSWSSNNSIFGNNITNNNIGIWLSWSSNSNNVFGNTITESYSSGIELSMPSNSNNVFGNTITQNSNGILVRANHNNVFGNTITQNKISGVYVLSANYTNVFGNNITENKRSGVHLRDCNNNKVFGNNITENHEAGVVVESSSNNTITENHIEANEWSGIVLAYIRTNYNNISKNVFVDDGLRNSFQGEGNVVSDNSVNGKPLVYLEGLSNHVIKNAGQVILVDCSNIQLNNLNLSNADYGVCLKRTNNTIISENNIANNILSIALEDSLNNTIVSNDVTNNYRGIKLLASSGNILGNNITNNEQGLWLFVSQTNVSSNSIIGNRIGINMWESAFPLAPLAKSNILENIIANNDYGIELSRSSNNTFYHNDFINNAHQVHDDYYDDPTDPWGPSVNFWDNGSEGNYWSDYKERYPEARQLDGSGIWDIPYVIDENNKDNYPLMNPVSQEVSANLYVKLVSSDDDYHSVDVYVDGEFWGSVGSNPRQTDYSEDIEVSPGEHSVEIRWHDDDCGGRDYSPPSLTEVVNAGNRVEFEFNIVMPFWYPDETKLLPPIGWNVLDARLVTVGSHSYFYIAIDQIPEVITVSDSDIETLADGFENIYSTEITDFGNPPDVDNDTHIYVLVHDIIDEGSAGQFDPRNQDGWNSKELIYLDYGGALPAEDFPNYGSDTLAHEFNHLIMHAYDSEEERWIQEGMAEFAKFDVFQRHTSNVISFVRGGFSSTSLVYESISGFDPASYGAAYLFFLYVYEHYGGVDTIREIFQDTNHGKESIENHLPEGVTFEDVFRDWAIANYLDADGGVYGYENIDIKQEISNHTTSHDVVSGDTIQGSREVADWAADYVWFTTEESHLRISFDGTSLLLPDADFLVKILLVETDDFNNFVVSDLALSDNEGSITVGPPLYENANSYQQIVLVTLRYPVFLSSGQYSYEALAYTPNSLKIQAQSPINIMVTAPDGLRVGYDSVTGSVINEIENATYSGPETEPQLITVFWPSAGVYVIDVFGTGTRTYTVTVKCVAKNGSITDSETWTGTTSPGELDTFSAQLLEDGTLVTVSTPFPWWILGAAAAVIIGIAVAVTILWRRRK